MSTLAADEHEGEGRADTNRHVSTQSNMPTEQSLLPQGDESVPPTCTNCFTLTCDILARNENVDQLAIDAPGHITSAKAVYNLYTFISYLLIF